MAPTPPANATYDAPFGLLIVGHGTDDPRGRAGFDQFVELVAQRSPGALTEGCFLEFAQPDIATGFERLYGLGVREVIVAPALLFSAGHAQRDIPAEIAKARAIHPDLTVRQAACLECHPALVRLSTEQYHSAIARAPHVAPEETALLMVGRGSHDAQAIAEFGRFARLRLEQAPVGWLETCFLAMQRPTLDEGLRLVAELPAKRIVIQPHLLFPGKLADRIEAQVFAESTLHAVKEYLIAPPLGADPLLAESLLARIAEAS